MAGGRDATQEGGAVVVHTAVLDLVAVPVGVDHQVGGPQVVRDRVAHAAAVQGTHATDDAIGGLVGVAGQHDVGLRAGQGRHQLGLRPVGRDAGAVVQAR